MPVDGKSVDIRFDRRGHLAALHLGHAVMGIEDEDIHRVQPPERLDRGRSRIATGGPHDGHTLARPAQGRLKQLTDQLHRKILEGERGPVEQLQQVMIAVQLHQRRAGGMAETGIGAGDDAFELGIGEGLADIGAHDAEGGFFIG